MLYQYARSPGMNLWCLFAIVAILFASPANANQSQAQMIKNTSVKKAPARTSAIIGQVKAQQKISILQRKGGWYQIDAVHTPQGWVKMLRVRFNRTPYRSGKTGFSSLLSVVKGGHSNITTTTGVRGFNEEDLKNSRADFLALNRMISFQVSAKASRIFARQGKLTARPVANMKENHHD